MLLDCQFAIRSFDIDVNSISLRSKTLLHQLLFETIFKLVEGVGCNNLFRQGVPIMDNNLAEEISSGSESGSVDL